MPLLLCGWRRRLPDRREAEQRENARGQFGWDGEAVHGCALCLYVATSVVHVRNDVCASCYDVGYARNVFCHCYAIAECEDRHRGLSLRVIVDRGLSPLYG